MFTDKYINDKYTDVSYTKLEEGDVVVCVKARDLHFIEGKEYKVYGTGYAGEMMVLTENKDRYALRPKQGGCCCTNTEDHWFRKKESDMNKEFKAGDWVFETKLNGEVSLEKLVLKGDYVCTDYECYNSFGINEKMPILQLVRATPENRKALVTLYGEETIPKLELTGGEAVKYLLERQKYVLCQVSNFSENHARKGDVVALIDSADMYLPEGSFYDGGDDWNYAVPIDMNKKEIVINLVEEK